MTQEQLRLQIRNFTRRIGKRVGRSSRPIPTLDSSSPVYMMYIYRR